MKKEMEQLPPRQLKPIVDRARRLQLSFKVRLAENDLAKEVYESHPRLSLFLSSHFERDMESGGLVNVHMDDENPQHIYGGYIVGSLKRKYNALPSNASLCAYLYTVHRNSQGSPCWVEVGTAHVKIRDLIKEKRVKVMMEMLVRTVVISGQDPIRKALIELTVDDIQMSDGIKFISNELSALDAPMERIQQTLQAYVQKTISLEESIPDTFPRTERMRAPFTLSPAAIESTGNSFLPVGAFALIDPPRANEAFYLNALTKVMDRIGHTIHDYAEMDLHQRCRMLASVCCYGIQTFDYISDEVYLQNRRHANETQPMKIDTDSFSDSTRTCSGDCEDGCRGIQCVKAGLMKIQATHPAIVDMQKLATKYCIAQALTVVHGAKIGDEEGYGAHLCNIFIPIEAAHTMLTHTKEGRALLKRMSPVKVLPVDSNSSASSKEDSLPFMVGEGTGIIDPLGVPVDPLAAERRYVAECLPSSAAFKREIPHIRDQPSTFYHGFELAVTSQWLEHGVGALIIGTRADNAFGMTRGALFTDMMAGRTDRIALLPQPRMPEEVMRISQEALALSPPPRPLELNQPLMPERKDALLERLCSTINSWKRPKTKAASGSIDLYVRAHQYDADKIDTLIQEASRMDALYAADYVEERFTDTVTSHRIRFWLNKVQ